jgi:hypothetical protein
MHMNELLNGELEKLAAQVGTRELDILETGCIRNGGEQYRINDGWSTWTFAKWVKDNGGMSMSIDLDVSVAHMVLMRDGLMEDSPGLEPTEEGQIVTDGIHLHQGYSVDVLVKTLSKCGPSSFDMILLDSDNDPNLILHEFFVAKHLVREGGVILIDDVGGTEGDATKGDAIVPWAQTHSIPYRTLTRTGDGYVTSVVVLEMP